ncbi:DNA translocase FtsK 4TM domain-containing protein, partial [Pelagibacteraceae bacterium]|nr:DNA translocase FtsK 4TM domain-containing protein [Pelagibacteraceae bacterium]
MFKYGSIRQFIIKFFFGIFLIVFSISYIGSLLSYDDSDPGFKILSNQDSAQVLSNNFGVFGSYLSSYSIIIIGSLSYVVGIFLLIEGVKSLFGLNNSYLVLRFISNLFGVFLVSIFVHLYGFQAFNSGLISIFLSDQLNLYLF